MRAANFFFGLCSLAIPLWAGGVETAKRIILVSEPQAGANAEAKDERFLAVRILAHCLNQTPGVEAVAWNGLPAAAVLTSAEAIVFTDAVEDPKLRPALATVEKRCLNLRIPANSIDSGLRQEDSRRQMVHGILKFVRVEPPTTGAPVTVDDSAWLPAWKDTPADQPPAGELLPLYVFRAGDRKWQPLVTSSSFSSWIHQGKSSWELKEGAVVGSGGKGYLFSPRADYKNFALRARVLLEKGGNSGLFFRVAEPAEQKLRGYEAQINHSHKDPVRTGSLFKIGNVAAKLIDDEGWFHLHVVADADRLQVRINDRLAVDLRNSEYAAGHIALQQHVDGSRVEFKDLEVIELK